MSHFRDEIAEQPEVASRLLQQSRDAVAAIGARIHEIRPRGYVIAARGSSDHAALYAKYLFGARNRALVALAAPSLFTHYASPPHLEDQCVIGISQSGASPDVVSVIEEARRQGALTVAISNDAESPLAKAADLVLTLGAGQEHSVPASKTYTASLLALALISQAVDPDVVFGAALSMVPEAMARALEMDSDLEKLVAPLNGTRAIVLGRGFNFSTAEELALKLMETSYLMARAWSVADFEHGPIAVVEAGIPVIVVDGGGAVATSMQSIRERIGAKGCPVVQLVDGKKGDKTGDVDPSTTVQLDSGLPEELTPISLAVLAQLLAHRVAVIRGLDPDSPREIRKVTRTW
ncbi:MAG TPA: SIS domain-containing protein [Candidatus Dormibacteraeota bacterium]|nr:SIS domain-containing protein [Candidatus Dormibacteraeota bacterium]